jgi:starch phosphorylase
VKAALDLISNGFFSRGDGALFRPLVDNLLRHDPYMLCADFASYLDAQTAADEAYMDREHWTRMSILNTARSGKFSSDRSIQEYCDDIWRVRPVPIRRDAGVAPATTCRD